MNSGPARCVSSLRRFNNLGEHHDFSLAVARGKLIGMERSMQRHPWMTTALAIIVGIICGFLAGTK